MNLSEYNKKMPEPMGLSSGVFYGQNERIDELNTRL